MQAMVPMNRLGSPDECAGTFLFLASDELSGYITGQVIEVNGGQSCRNGGAVTRPKKEGLHLRVTPWFSVVGIAGFEPATPPV